MTENSSTETRPLHTAFLWLLFLGPFFFLMYGTSNWFTSLRPEVGSYYFEWEQYIPFVPLMIIPYMSTDMMFAGALFLCRTREELRTLAFRFTLAICISTAGFLLFPLRFAFPRPPVDGLLGSIFKFLTSFDQPFNQAPSLHISLLIIQWMVYAKHTRGWLRRLIHIWCALIGVSTVLTFQHHIIDLYTGVTVAMFTYYMFPDQARGTFMRSRLTTIVTTPSVFRHDLILYYASGFAALFGLAWLYWQPLHFLLWPAAALGLIAVAYTATGTAVFLKFEGHLSLCSRLALAPFLLGSYLSYRLYTKNTSPYDQVIPGLWIGRKLTDSEAKLAVRASVSAVVDLTAEFDEATPFLKLPYCNIQIMDLTPVSANDLDHAVTFIREQIRKGPVLVHCALGYSRSAAVIAAYLLAEGHAHSIPAAEHIIRRARPQIVLSSQQRMALEQYRHIVSPSPDIRRMAS